MILALADPMEMVAIAPTILNAHLSIAPPIKHANLHALNLQQDYILMVVTANQILSA